MALVRVVFSCQKMKDSNIQRLLWLTELFSVALHHTDAITMHYIFFQITMTLQFHLNSCPMLCYLQLGKDDFYLYIKQMNVEYYLEITSLL